MSLGQPITRAEVIAMISRAFHAPPHASLHDVIDEAVIEQAGRRLLQAAPRGARVILFGSHARGEAGEHSDLDFLVIEQEVENAARESVRLDRALHGIPVPTDVIVVSVESVREWRDVYGTVINAALDEGRELVA
jgi:uncharacterized protein